MKKRSEETQAVSAGCSKAQQKNFNPPQTRFPAGTGWPKFNQLEMVATFTYKPSGPWVVQGVPGPPTAQQSISIGIYCEHVNLLM